MGSVQVDDRLAALEVTVDRVLIVLLALALSCGRTPTPAEAPAGSAEPRPGSAAVSGAFPSRVDDLATLVPLDAAFVVEAPDPSVIASALAPEQRALVELVRPSIEQSAAEELAVDEDTVHHVFTSLDGALVFGGARSVALLARFKPGGPVERLLRSDRFEAVDEPIAGATVMRLRAAKDVRVAWFAAAGVLLVSTDRALASAVERTARGRGRSFAESQRRLPPDRASLRLYADFGALAAGLEPLRGLVDAGSSGRASISVGPAGLRSSLEISLVGERLPGIDEILTPSPSTLAARLPDETVAFSSIAVGRSEGRSIRDLLADIVRASGGPAAAIDALDALLKDKLGLDLSELDRLLGAEILLGLAVDPNKRMDLERDAPDKAQHVAFFAVAATRDDALARKLVEAGGKLVRTPANLKTHTVSTLGGTVRLVPKKPDAPAVRIEAKKGVVVVAGGGARWLDRLSRALDTREKTLSSKPAFQAAAKGLASPMTAATWVDMNQAMYTLRGEKPFADAAFALGRVVLRPSSKGIDLVADGENGMEVALAGAGAAVAIYGVRRYLAASKVSEAKNTVGAISRGAVAAFEREGAGPSGTVSHRLCGSAKPVPAQVPSGTKHQPDAKPGADFDSGDAARGWRCLKFMMTVPHFYQYEYRQGGPYKGPARGGPDPGPNGFEVSAEGDLDADGQTSLFTRTGTVDPKTQQLKLSPELFVSNELE
jgi:hypothetical protein